MPSLDTPLVQVYYRSDIGQKRRLNEDAVGAGVPDASERWAKDGVLLVVADGLGGHDFGDRASRYAVVTLIREYYQLTPVAPEHRLRQIIKKVNRDLYEYALEKLGADHKVATTIVAAVVRQGTVQTAHVGDSRAYLIRAGKAYRLTRDHSFVEEQVRQGLMTPEEAERSPFRNRISRSVGGRAEVEVEVAPPLPLLPGDVLLLCSDGLTRYVHDEELGEAFAPRRVALETAVERLIQAANVRGGADNVTVLAARYRGSKTAAWWRAFRSWRVLSIVLALLILLLLLGSVWIRHVRIMAMLMERFPFIP